MIEAAADGGVVITIVVVPRSSKAGIAGTRGDALLVRLNAAPVDDAANAELIEVMASALGCPKRAITIVAGSHARRKRVRVAGVDADTATELLRTRIARVKK
jgi:uncharacterized protein (TIGR00251 family)